MNASDLQGIQVGAINQQETVEHYFLDFFHLFDNKVSSNFDLYSGGFVGIDLNNLQNLETDINGLVINPVSEKLNGFGGDESTWNQGLKGKAQEAAIKYVQAIKQLLAAYISTYNQFITLANESARALVANDTANANVINDAVQSITTMAQGIETEAAHIDVNFGN